MYPYPYDQQSEEREYSKEISRVFGILSIFFGMFLPPTGIILGIAGLVYEKKDADKNESKYSFMNLGLNASGMLIGTLYLMYLIMFKWNLL